MYSGTARFIMEPFVVEPADCNIKYVCKMRSGPAGYDLCDYNDGTTIASYNEETGDYEFTSTDFATFGV